MALPTHSAGEVKREQDMKVLVLGFPRTGTTSLRCAFRELGYKHHYYWDSIRAGHKDDSSQWIELLNRKFSGAAPITREDFDAILANYTTLADWPCSLFAEELISAYPEAKIILSVRDSADAWYKSFADTVWRYQRIKFFPKGPWERFWDYLSPRHQNRTLLGIIMTNTPLKDFETVGKQWYLEHNENLRNIVPKERLLEFNVKQGWEPLCDFLGEPVPACDFPGPILRRSSRPRLIGCGCDSE